MRTIIINTLGRELTKNPLFFLPFREDHLFWLERDLGSISACAEEIASICNDQLKRQDYRLVVLTDPVSFYQGKIGLARQCYQKLILALLNRNLLAPLVCQSNLIPRSVTVVYLVSHQQDGDRGIQGAAVLDRVFGIDASQQPIETLRLTRVLPGGNLEYLDVSSLFETTLQDHRNKTDRRKALNQNLDNALVFADLRQALHDDLEALQTCSYVPAGGTSEINLPIRLLEFIPKTTVPQLIWADLQLDLSDYLANQVLRPNADAELQLPTHTQEDLERRISRAESRIHALLRSAPRQSYYPLKNQSRPSRSESLTGMIWDGLSKDAAQLPGVAEARTHHENPTKPRSEGPTEKLKRYWILVGQEKKLFQQLCQRLDSEYSEELVEKQQQSILEICAKEFRNWRSAALRQKISLPPEPSEVIQPEPDMDDLRERLEQAQEECTRVTAERLADFSDVRQEAEVIKARFRKAGRFWAPQSGSSTYHFQMFSGVMAMLFLAQILLPYVGITLGQSGIAIDRYVHFLLSIGVFAGLYGIGLLFWLRNLCEELHGYSEQMSRLIWQSARRREDSIETAVEAYSTVLPECLLLNEDLRELEYIHATNEARKAHFNAHMDTLRRAEELLQELSTELQMRDRSHEIDPVKPIRGIDYQLPPSHGRNLPFYMLLSDRWGGA